MREASSTFDQNKQTNYFVYHNTFAAPNVKVDFIGSANVPN